MELLWRATAEVNDPLPKVRRNNVALAESAASTAAKGLASWIGRKMQEYRNEPSKHRYPSLHTVRFNADKTQQKQITHFPGTEECFTAFRLLKQHDFAQDLAGGALGKNHPLGLLVREDQWPGLRRIVCFTSRPPLTRSKPS